MVKLFYEMTTYVISNDTLPTSIPVLLFVLSSCDCFLNFLADAAVAVALVLDAVAVERCVDRRV